MCSKSQNLPQPKFCQKGRFGHLHGYKIDKVLAIRPEDGSIHINFFMRFTVALRKSNCRGFVKIRARNGFSIKNVENPTKIVPCQEFQVRAKPCRIHLFSVPGISVPDLKFLAVPGRAITVKMRTIRQHNGRQWILKADVQPHGCNGCLRHGHRHQGS